MNGIPNPPALRKAAAHLVTQLRGDASAEFQVGLLKRLAQRLDGDGDYPLFIKLLAVVGGSDDESAKLVLASALGASLRRMDVPSGRLTSWGASQLWAEGASAAELNRGYFARAPTRQLGPIEFLCVWASQSTQRPLLSGEVLQIALADIVRLVDADPDARARYIERLEAIASGDADGAYTAQTRERVGRLASAWRASSDAAAIARAALAESGYGDSGVLLRPL